MSEILTADQARALTKIGNEANVLEYVLAEIKSKALQGEKELRIYDHGFNKELLPEERRSEMQYSLIQSLRELGYTVGVKRAQPPHVSTSLVVQW